MAIDINWVTGEITIPKADLTLILGDFYSYDSDAFRKEVMTKYAAEEGGPWPTPFTHNTEVTIAGFVFARQIIIHDAYYFVTFEALGNYRVRIDGSNNNIHEVATINGVSIEPSNSGGLISGTLMLAILQAELESIEGGHNHAALMRLLLASAANKLSGAPTGPIILRDLADTKNRQTTTVDANGNRTAVTQQDLTP